MSPERRDSAAAPELLAAYALDACAPEEAAALEALLTRRPELAAEAARLAEAAAWVGATEALAAPEGLRAAVLDSARLRWGHAELPAPARGYVASLARLEQTLGTLEPDDGDVPTANGLTVRELVVHLAAQESLLAQAISASPFPDLDQTDVETRTAALVARSQGQSLDAACDLWRDAVAAVRAWAVAPVAAPPTAMWLGFELPRDDLLVIRAFENWVHRDDLRRAVGRRDDAPPAAALALMSDLSVRSLPLALAATGRGRPGKVARVVLTGVGGGDWHVPMDAAGLGEADRGQAELGEAGRGEADVVLTADALDWCRMAAERLDAARLTRTVQGDQALADDLIASASALATL